MEEFHSNFKPTFHLHEGKISNNPSLFRVFIVIGMCVQNLKFLRLMVWAADSTDIVYYPFSLEG